MRRNKPPIEPAPAEQPVEVPPRQVVIVEEEGRGCTGTTLAVLGAIISGGWLLNFTMGIVELPDALPIVGNLDEATAAAVFFGCMRYLGFDLIPFGDKSFRSGPQSIDVTPQRKNR
jgi:hypothetical protein